MAHYDPTTGHTTSPHAGMFDDFDEGVRKVLPAPKTGKSLDLQLCEAQHEAEQLAEALKAIVNQPIGHTAADSAKDLAACINIARAALARHPKG